ncbi:MAG: hypothetical protein IJS00_04360 [Paludibacteraceae bacterium]|nr:hypothetical protein [Paludibacteraceae bacterium]
MEEVVVPSCSTLTGSLQWCEGKTVLPGIRRRLYYVSKNVIASWPAYKYAEEDGVTQTDRITEAYLEGDITLYSGYYWNVIDVLADKSGVTSEPQGEKPSQTQLNKLVAVHPGVGEEATKAALYINNNDCVYLIQDMRGNFRMIGNELWQGKSTVNQDLGQGPTGTPSTTINVEHTDLMPAPFYRGLIKISNDEGIQAAYVRE